MATDGVAPQSLGKRERAAGGGMELRADSELWLSRLIVQLISFFFVTKPPKTRPVSQGTLTTTIPVRLAF